MGRTELVFCCVLCECPRSGVSVGAVFELPLLREGILTTFANYFYHRRYNDLNHKYKKDCNHCNYNYEYDALIRTIRIIKTILVTVVISLIKITIMLILIIIMILMIFILILVTTVILCL